MLLKYIVSLWRKSVASKILSCSLYSPGPVVMSEGYERKWIKAQAENENFFTCENWAIGSWPFRPQLCKELDSYNNAGTVFAFSDHIIEADRSNKTSAVLSAPSWKNNLHFQKKHVIKGLRFISTPLLKNRAVVHSLKFATEERCNSFWKWDTIRSPLWCAKGGVPAMPGIQELILILPLFHIE